MEASGSEQEGGPLSVVLTPSVSKLISQVKIGNCVAVLNRLRTWLETHQVENNGLLRNIRDSLNDYEAKLQDLRAVLQEAAAQAKQATGLNGENEGVLGAIQVSRRQKPPHAFINGGAEGNGRHDQAPVWLFCLRP